MHSVRQGWAVSSLLHVLTLEPLLHKLGALRSILRDLGGGRYVSEDADDVTVVMPDHKHTEMFGTALRDYEVVSGLTRKNHCILNINYDA